MNLCSLSGLLEGNWNLGGPLISSYSYLDKIVLTINLRQVRMLFIIMDWRV